MSGWVALLRGINVGGRNKLPMASLKAIGESLGLRDVSTYINSGNLLFSNKPMAGLASDLAKDIRRLHGIEIPVVICSTARLDGALEANPFVDADPKRVLVYFCSETPSKSAVAKIDMNRSKTEELAVVGGELFLSVPDGAHKTKLTLAYLEKILGVTMTSRNLNTVRKLSGLTHEIRP